MTEATLVRSHIRFEREFTQLPNAWLRDNQLSFRSRGLLALLMSHKPGEFKVTIKALASDNPEGVDALRAAVEELEKLGYLKRYRKAPGGQFQPDTWELCDPHELDRPTMLAALDKPTRRQSALDNPTRTALDKPTPIRTLKEHSVVNETRSLRECPVSVRVSPTGLHSLTDLGLCVNCGADLRIEVSA